MSSESLISNDGAEEAEMDNSKSEKQIIMLRRYEDPGFAVTGL